MMGVWNAVPMMQIAEGSFPSVELEVSERADWACLVITAKSLKRTI